MTEPHDQHGPDQPHQDWTQQTPAADGQWDPDAAQQPNSGWAPQEHPQQWQPGGYPAAQSYQPEGQPQQGWAPPSGQYPQQGGQYPQTGQYPQQGQYAQTGQYPQQGRYPGGPAGPVGPGGPQGGWPGQPAPKKSHRTAIIAGVAAVVVASGAAATYVALGDKGSAGASSPHSAVSKLVTDLDKADLLGVLDHLPPGERASIVDPITDQVKQLKRLKVLSSSADPKNVSGLDVSATALTYASGDEKINDHLTIVKLTGGKITVNVDLSKVPYTQEFLKIAFKGRSTPTGSRTRTIDIGQVVKQTGEPIRIATQEVSGKWYPSLLYTIADNAVHSGNGRNPTSADYIPAAGASSAEDAVRGLLDAAGKQDATAAIKLLSPDEMAVVHDYGGLIVKGTGSPDPSNTFTVTDATFDTSKVSGGTLVSIKSVTVNTSDGKYGFSVDGDCVSYTSPDNSGKFCAADALKSIGRDSDISADQKAALQRLFTALPKIGIVATQSGGKWYVSPLRSYGDLLLGVLGNLQDNDLLTLLSLIDN
ncbi:MAG: hypothetical protein ACR2KJ_06415 [Jatrophihabitans sp.]